MNRKKPIVFLLFFLFFFLKSFAPAVQAISPVYDNPGQGVFECHDQSRIGTDYLKGGGVIVRWDSLQPVDTDSLNQAAVSSLVKAIKKLGKKSYLHFQIFSPTGCDAAITTCDFSPLPDWLKVRTVTDSRFGTNPLPWDAEFQTKLRRFLMLLKKAFDDNGANGFIEYLEPSIGPWCSTGLWLDDSSLSRWAEAAGCAETDWNCLGSKRTEGINAIAEAYLTVFTDLPITMIVESCRYAGCNYSGLGYLLGKYGMKVMVKEAGLGHRWEGVCGIRDYAFSSLCSYKPLMTKCIHEPWAASTVCEGRANMGFDPAAGCGYEEVLMERALSRERLSYYCFYSNDIGCSQRDYFCKNADCSEREYLKTIDEVNRLVSDHIGAQIYIKEAKLDAAQKDVGQNLKIDIKWQNQGSASLTAPLKEGLKWTPSSYKLFLEFERNGAVAHYQELNLNPPTNSWETRNLLGDYTTSNTLIIPAALGGSSQTAAVYKLYAGLTDPNGEKKRFALRNTDGRNDLERRRYLLSDSFWVGGGVVPATNPTVAPTGGPTISPAPCECPSGVSRKTVTDANCNGKVDLSDFFLWRDEFLSSGGGRCTDFDSNGRINLSDFFVWRTDFLAQ